MPSFEEMAAGYANMWRSAKVEPGRVANVKPAVDRIIRDRKRYEAVEASTGVPWFWIAAAHDREASGSFAGVLHNGEKIIGTGRKTTLVPKGRGPFATWEAAAADALDMKGLPDIDDWSIERMLYEFERFNGMGYVARGQNSPYVWADTNHEELGKFVADGRYDPSVDDQQRGCAAILLMLCERDAGVRERVNGKAPAPTAPSAGKPAPGRSLVAVLLDLLAAMFGKRTPSGSAAKPAAQQGADRWLSISAKEIGVKETPGPTSTPRIIEYRKIAGCDLKGDDGAVAWCKVYVNAIFALAGLPIARNWMARSIESDPNFIRLPAPAIGAVCSFWRASRTGGLGHTGFYRGETASGKILVEGGNESDAVRRAFYPKNGQSMGLIACYWPASLPLPDVGPVYVDDDGSPIASAA